MFGRQQGHEEGDYDLGYTLKEGLTMDSGT